MSSFGDQLRAWAAEIKEREQRVFAGCVAAAKQSITLGSAITGAPGQPVDTAELRDSWTEEHTGPREAVIYTDKVYARSIEDGVSYAHDGQPLTLRSQVGGFHSVKLTRRGWQALVDDVTRQVTETRGALVMRYSLNHEPRRA